MARKCRKVVKIAKEIGDRRVGKVLQAIFSREKKAYMDDSRTYNEMIEEVHARIEERHTIISELKTFVGGPILDECLADLKDAEDADFADIGRLLQMSHAAAIKVAHPDKIAIGGHSYGAFMTANLLAHAPHFFCCGVARSGAYNRTLTPFGFQNEDRTLWDATDTYIKMSPFMAANKIKKPILLIHGEEDNNSGTLTMQSDRFFQALKGHGALSCLVILPFESHGYSSRESIMHFLWETDRCCTTDMPVAQLLRNMLVRCCTM